MIFSIITGCEGCIVEGLESAVTIQCQRASNQQVHGSGSAAATTVDFTKQALGLVARWPGKEGTQV